LRPLRLCGKKQGVKPGEGKFILFIAKTYNTNKDTNIYITVNRFDEISGLAR